MWRIAAVALLACAGCAGDQQAQLPSVVPTTRLLLTPQSFFKPDQDESLLPVLAQEKPPATAR